MDIPATIEKLKATAHPKSGATAHERQAAKEKITELEAKLEGKGKLDDGYRIIVEHSRKAIEKAALADEECQWTIGEDACKVEKKYGEARIEKFANDIGFTRRNAYKCRETYLAWRAIVPPAALLPFWTSYELNNHPKRLQIAQSNPNMTKEKAREKMQAFKAEEKAKRDAEAAKKKAAKEKAEAAKKKATANGKDHKPEPQPEPEPEPEVIREDVKKLAGIFDATCSKGGLEEKRAKQLGKCNEEERKLVLGTLWELKDRVDRLISKFTSKED